MKINSISNHISIRIALKNLDKRAIKSIVLSIIIFFLITGGLILYGFIFIMDQGFNAVLNLLDSGTSRIFLIFINSFYIIFIIIVILLLNNFHKSKSINQNNNS